jgi:hypothetical protein
MDNLHGEEWILSTKLTMQVVQKEDIRKLRTLPRRELDDECSEFNIAEADRQINRTAWLSTAGQGQATISKVFKQGQNIVQADGTEKQ